MNMNAADQPKPVISFIGLGIMGAAMAGNLLKAGYQLRVYNRTPAKMEPLVAEGALPHDSPEQAAAGADVVITMVGLPSDVEAVYLTPGGIVESARSGAILIDMTTSSPSLAARIHEAASARGLHSLDAPVSGGDAGARNAQLSIMVGGESDVFERALPVLKIMGSNVVLQGGPGAGQHTKMCNQVVIAGTMLGVAEGLAYARKSGLDAHRVLESISAGAAGGFLLNAFGRKMLEGDFAPGFMIEHFIKDIKIALAEADAIGLNLSGLRTAHDQYQKRSEAGDSRAGTQALFKNYT